MHVNAETALGVKLGAGPVAVTRWQRTRRLDRAGVFGLDAPASDSRASILALRRYVRCWHPQLNVLTDVGHGIIDQIGIDATGQLLSVSGDDLMRELAMRSVGFISLKDPANPVGSSQVPISLSAALAIIQDQCNNNSVSLEDWTVDLSTYESTGNTTSGNDTITNVANISNFTNRIGTPIYGAGVAAGATVTAVGSTTITMSANATTTATAVPISRWQLFHDFAGESVLQALIKVAELTGTHFRLGVGREIVWLYHVHPPSGLRAVIAVDPVAAETNTDICLITGLEYIKDSSDLISRIHPFGSGSGSSRLALADDSHPGVADPNVTTRSAPAGYTLNLDFNFLERTLAETDFGFNVLYETFNDIGVSVPDTDPDYATALVNARNQLFDAALAYLRTHSYPQESYRLSVTKLDQEVLPGETIRVIYSGWTPTIYEPTGQVVNYQWIDIDADLLVLEATTEIDSGGIGTPSLVVATIDRWPTSDVELVVKLLRDVRQAQSHRQVLIDDRLDLLTVTDAMTLSSPAANPTLTIPATGTAALLGTPNVFTADQQISADVGIGTTPNATDRLVVRENQNAASIVRVQNLQASGNTSAAAQFTAESGTSSGFVGAFPSDYVTTRFQDRLVVGAGSTSSGITFNASTAGHTMTFYAGSSTLLLTLSSGQVALGDGANLAFGTSTGSKLATASSQKLGFWGVAPIVQPVLAAYTSDAESVAYTGAADGEARLVDLNSLRVAYEALRQAHDDLRTKLITTGILA